MSETVIERIPVPILYTNWRGETAVRKIVPHTRHPVVSGKPSLWFGSTQWHPEPQWLLTAVDVEKGAVRDWALSGIKAWGEEAVSAALASTAGAGAGDWQPISTAPKDGTPIVGCALGWQQAERFEFVCAGSSPMGWRGPSGRVADYMQPTLWKPWPVPPGQSPAVPASPRSGAGEGEVPTTIQGWREKAEQHLREGLNMGILYEELPALISALSQGGGAGRSEKGEGEVRQAAEHLLDGYRGLEAILAGMDADIPDAADVVVRVPGSAAQDLGTYGQFRALDHALKGLPASPTAPAEHGVEIKDLVGRARLQAASERAIYGDDAGELYDELADAIVSALSQADAAGRSERAVEIKERAGAVFIIIRTTGEYSDRSEDLIAATFDGEAAKRWTEETQRVCQTLAAETNRALIEEGFETEQTTRAAAKSRCPDPTFEPWGGYAEDVQYGVREIKIGLPAPAQSPSTSDREG